MKLRFRKSVKLAPGLRLSLGGKSASMRVGGRHLGVSVSTSGRQTMSGSLPGTGLGFVSRNGAGRGREPSAPVEMTHVGNDTPTEDAGQMSSHPYPFVWTPRKVVGWIVTITAVLVLLKFFSALHGGG